MLPLHARSSLFLSIEFALLTEQFSQTRTAVHLVPSSYGTTAELHTKGVSKQAMAKVFAQTRGDLFTRGTQSRNTVLEASFRDGLGLMTT